MSYLYIPIINKVRCKKCNDIIESKFTHDMVSCRCKAISVDGGNEYQKLTGDIGNIDTSYSEYKKVKL